MKWETLRSRVNMQPKKIARNRKYLVLSKIFKIISIISAVISMIVLFMNGFQLFGALINVDFSTSLPADVNNQINQFVLLLIVIIVIIGILITAYYVFDMLSYQQVETKKVG